MASVMQKDGRYYVRFRFGGQNYKKSIKIRDHKESLAARNLVEVTIHRIKTGQLLIPPGIDHGDFIILGGNISAARERTIKSRPNIAQAVQEYHQSQQIRLAPSTQLLYKYHLNRWLPSGLQIDVANPLAVPKTRAAAGIETSATSSDPAARVPKTPVEAGIGAAFTQRGTKNHYWDLRAFSPRR